MKDGLTSPWFRLLACFIVSLLLNTYAGGHQLVAAWAEARDVREHNAAVLEKLKLPEPLTAQEIAAKKAAARARIAEARRGDRARQAAGLAELHEASAAAWMEQDTRNLAAVSRGVEDVAQLTEGILRGHRSDAALIADGIALAGAAENVLALTERLADRGALAGDHVSRIRDGLAPASLMSARPQPEEVRAVAEALAEAMGAQVARATAADRARQNQRQGRRVGAPIPLTRPLPPREPLTGKPGRDVISPYVWDFDGAKVAPPARTAADLRARFADAPNLRIGAPDAARLDPPDAADLEETLDAPITDVIRAKADALGGDAIDLYRFVADEIDYAIYAGSVHGAQGTLDSGVGNDVDQASLLIALLRAADIPARYESGTVFMSAEQVAATTGIQDVYTAYQTLANQGVASIIVVDDGDYSGIQLERTWVSAFVPYTQYRGVREQIDGGEEQWVRLDPAFMNYAIEQRFEVAPDVDFDADGFLSQPPHISPIAFYDDALRDHLAATGTRCENLDDVVARLDHRPIPLDLLPHTLPYEMVSDTARASSLTGAQRLKIGVELVSSWGFPVMEQEVEAVGAYGKILALTFPAGEGIYSSTTGSVKPTLSLGGEILEQTGDTSVGIGYSLYVTTRVPGGKAPTKRHQVTAGGAYSINVHTGPVGSRLVNEAEDTFRSLVEAGAPQNRLELSLAYLASLRFAGQGYADGKRAFAMHRWVPYTIRESITGTNLIPTSVFGFPVGASYGGMFIDAQSFFFAVPMEGRRVEATQGRIAELTGYNGSYLEHRIWEEVTGVEFGSSTNVLQWARAEGQAIYTFESTEAYEAVQGDLNHASPVLADVEEALEQGFEVIISQRSVTRGDANVSGYILRDPVSGAGQFLISGGLGGGLQTIYTWILELLQAIWDFIVCNYPVASEVDVGTGCLSDNSFVMGLYAHSQRRDLTFSYQSKQDRPSDLGGGWGWTFGMRLFPDPESGEVTLLYEDAFLGVFTPDDSGGYSPPYRQRDRLEAQGDGWTVTRRDQTVWAFNSDGLLISEADPHGNVITISRDGDGLPTALLDEDGRTLLTISTDDEGHITELVDAVGRTVALSYVDGRLATTADPAGGLWSYGYDSQGRLIRRVDPTSEPTTYGYDGEGRLARYTTPSGDDGFVAYDAINRRSVLEDATGAERLFDINETGDIEAFIDPVGNKTTYAWEDGELTSMADPRGSGLTRTYDDKGQLLSATDSTGTTVEATWDELGRPTSYVEAGETVTLNWDPGGQKGLILKDPAGATAVFEMDDDGRPTHIDGGEGTQMNLSWEDDGRLAAITDGEGNTTEYTMDAGGRVESITQPDGGTLTFEWDGGDHLTTFTTPTGATWEMGWSPYDELTSLKHPTGVTETWTWDGPWLLAHTDADGGVTRYERDAEGRALTVVEPTGATVSVQRDAAGRILAVTDRYGQTAEAGYCAELGASPCDLIDPQGNLIQRIFDGKGRLTEESDGRGSRSYEYDSFGHLAARVDRLGHRTEYQWGERGDLEEVIDALDQVTSYSWDKGGHLTAVTDASQATTEYVRDDRGRLTQVIDALDRVTHFTFDGRGNPATRLAPGGDTTAWQFNGDGNITSESFEDGAEHTYTFDSQGRRTRAVGPSGDVEYRYEDPRGRVSTVIDHLTGHRLDITWEAVTGRVHTVTRPDGTYTYQWSQQGDLLAITLPSGERLTQTFDELGRQVERRFPNGVVEEQVWDTFGRLAAKLTRGPDGRYRLGASYTYDALDRRASETTVDGEVTTYTYDALGRLTDVDGPDGHVQWTYDEVGNRLSESLDGAVVAAYTYDATHRLLSKTVGGVETTYTWDDVGRLMAETTAGETTTYTYDGAGRLTGVDAPGEAPLTYGYDADGRRTLTEDASGTWLTTWDDFHPVASLGGDGSREPAYIFAHGIDDPLGVTDVVSGETTWLHTDPLGSVIGQSDADGAPAGQWAYAPFGAPAGEAPADLAFAARPYSGASGLVDMRARSYNPADGRFIQPDPVTPVSFEMRRTGAPAAITELLGGGVMQLLMNPQQLNPYTYVSGDPINFTDPAGEMLRKECLGIWMAINMAISLFLMCLSFATGFGGVVIAASIALAILDHLRGNGGSFGPPTWGDALNVVGIVAGPLVKGFSAGGPLAKFFGSGGMGEQATQLTDFFVGQAIKYTNIGLGAKGLKDAAAEHDAAVQQQNVENNMAMMDRA